MTLGADGRNPGTETADEIWSDLLEDCFDGKEADLIEAIRENSPTYIVNPYYNKTVVIEGSEESFTANLLWYEQKVILFLEEAYDDYLIAKKTGWHVFCTKEGFDPKELLERVGV